MTQVQEALNGKIRNIFEKKNIYIWSLSQAPGTGSKNPWYFLNDRSVFVFLKELLINF